MQIKLAKTAGFCFGVNRAVDRLYQMVKSGEKVCTLGPIIHNPQVVFLDEPTGGIDPITRRQFWQLIKEAAAKGITIFITTHYMDEAEFCNRISVMVDGKVKALDTPQNLKNYYNVKRPNKA